MSARIPRLLIIHLLLLCAHTAYSQDDVRAWRVYEDSISVSGIDTIRLSRQFVQSHGFELKFIPEVLYDPERDVTLLGRDGLLVFSRELRDRLDAGAHSIVVRYRALPFRFTHEFRRRDIVTRSDSILGADVQIATPSTPLSMESIFGSELDKSGYIGRGFTVGTNRDLNINSGFRLQLAGKLSDDISIVGALTDENTPIQPEGNTRTIQELDKVFIKISGRDLAATLGDFTLNYSDTEFGRYNRKLSGVLGQGATRDARASVSYASLKGSFNSMQFNGIDGVQGPYRLTGRGGERPVLVLAGTERVYVDGIEMVRGENNDYVIEYGSGELYFTPRRLITSYARITVDYEYAERQYTRSLFTANTSGELFSKGMSLTARYIREGDDPDNPIDRPLDDSDRRLLAATGDNPSLASRSGVTYVGYDPELGAGAGQYVRVDTLIAGELRDIYRYDPGSDSATYSLTFAFAGSGRGDYRRRSIGSFEFVGTNAGDYTPLRLLPLPRLHQLLDLYFGMQPTSNLRLNGELGVSSLDLNRFSDLDSGDDVGTAYNLSGNWNAGSTPFGGVDVSARFRSSGVNFNPIDRINDIEFARKWDMGAARVSREELGEASVTMQPFEALSLSAGAGSIRRGDFASMRVDAAINLQGTDQRRAGSLPDVRYNFEYISSDDERDDIRGRWFRQRGDIRHRMRIGEPRLRVEHEHRLSLSGPSDTLRHESLGFIDIRPGMLFHDLFGMNFSADIGVRVEDAPLLGQLQRKSTDLLQQYALTLPSWNNLSATATVTIRDRMFSDAWAMRGERDMQTILTRMQSRYAPLNGGITADVLYEISTERTSRLERVFLSVPFGQGNYVYLGDLNNNGIQDEEEFEPTRYDGDFILFTIPTDELFPVIDLKNSFRLRVQPDRFIDRSENGVLKSVLRSLSSETFLRIDEKSEDENTANIYALRLSTFLNDSNTIRGFQNLRQDVFLFERGTDLSLRLRFDERRGFSQFALTNERSYRRERSMRLKTQLVREIGIQSDLIFLDDAVLASSTSSRARDIGGSELILDLSYRPWPKLEIGFVVSSKKAVDNYPDVPVDASIQSQALRAVASFDGPGRLRAELERNSVNFATEVTRFPYELTDGRAEGESWVMRINFDYRLTTFMQATLSYLGRSEAERPVIHTARAEVKAFF